MREDAMNTAIRRGKRCCLSEVYFHCARNYVQTMMILAMAMGHTVGSRHGNRGGAINPMEQSYQLPSDCLVDRKVNKT